MSASPEVQQVEEDQIASVVRRVVRASAGRVAPAAIESLVREGFASWQEARIRDFLPVLVERAVMAKLGLQLTRVPDAVPIR